MAASKPVVLATRKLPEPVEERLRASYQAILNPDDRPLSPDELLRRADGVDGILCTLTDRLSAAAIAALPARVRILATFSVGHEHIDLQAAQARGLCVTNTPGALTEATADIAFLLMLGAARRAYEGERLLRSGQWQGWAPTQLMGTALQGKRLGIAGMGRIGQAVARRALAFGMTVRYTGRKPRDLGPGLPATFHADDAAFLAECDVLSLHMASTPETRHWLDARRVGLLPKGAIVVNTARGDLVDDGALIDGLTSGHLRAAGLDVFAGEPAIDARYRDISNAMLLPHLGSATFETRCAMGFRALDNLDAFFAGAPPRDKLA
ncbi:MAG TPA: D-glycerate dehydrogenase [Alphaproteobacteria bacterium]|jgi:lactate dehydrogenase-like 2-hydroxyacid dehydrogenase